MFENLNLSELRYRARKVLRPPSSTRPALWLLEEGGVWVVVKDFSANQRFYRNTIGRFLIWREHKALRQLVNIQGIPKPYRVIDGLALVIEDIQGRTLENLELDQKLDVGFFERLKAIILRFHARGMAHCDLKRAANIMVDANGQPCIIDWGASISKSEFRFFPLNRIFERFQQDDLLAVVKMKLRHCPESVTPEEEARLYRRSLPERAIRRVRDRLRAYLQRVV